MKDISDPKLFTDAQAAAKDLVALASDRNESFDQGEKIFFMDQPDDIPDADNLKVTISPDGRNKVLGAARLLSATDPIPTVTREGLDTSVAGEIENALRQMWTISGRMAGNDLHYDAALSCLLYANVHLTVILTSELVKLATGTSPANVRRLENLAAKTPLLFRIMTARGGYPRYDALGMDAYYREEETTLGAIRKQYGSAAEGLTGNDNDLKVLCDWWDLTYHFVSIQGDAEPILAQEHELPFIPVAVSIAEGSRLWKEEKRRLQPFLYTLFKSGVHQRQSLSLTTIYTKLAQFGSSPLWMIERGSVDGKIEFDASGVIPVAYTNPGDRVQPGNANMIDPNLYRSLEIANGLAEQSTLYGQALGQPLSGGNATFSATALLSQAGRLPLIATQKAVSRAIGDIMQMGLEWLGLESINHALLKNAKLNEPFDVEVKLDVKLPQDLVKNAGMFQQLQGKVSDGWLLENLLQITDPDEQRRQLAKEMAFKAKFQSRLQAAMQAAMQQGQPGQPGAQSPVKPGQAPEAPAPQQGPTPQAADGSLQAPLPSQGEMTGGGDVPQQAG